jgi:hypothetical protein
MQGMPSVWETIRISAEIGQGCSEEQTQSWIAQAQVEMRHYRFWEDLELYL